MNSIKLKDILFVVIFMSFSQLIRSDDKEFCQYFADNHFKIDFGLYHYFSPDEDDPHRYYLFIGSNYWTLERDDFKVSVDTKNKFDASDWMNNTYRGALHSTVCPKKICDQSKESEKIAVTAFVNPNPSSIKSSTKERWEVVLKPLDRSSAFGPELYMTNNEEYKKYDNQKRHFQLDANPGIPFNFPSMLNIFCILWQNSVNQGFERNYRCFQFDIEANILDKDNVRIDKTDLPIDTYVKHILNGYIEKETGIKSDPDQLNFLNIRATREVSAILFYDVSVNEDQKKGSFLLLHSFDKKLVYCWTEGILFNKVVSSLSSTLIICFKLIVCFLSESVNRMQY